MPTIIMPTSAEALAAVYLHERNKCIEAVQILSEAIDRLHDVVRGESGASADEIAYIINRAQETARETLLFHGGERVVMRTSCTAQPASLASSSAR